MELVKSGRNKDLLFLDNFKFWRQHSLKSGEEKWRCSVKSCPAVLKTIKLTTDLPQITESRLNHSHPPIEKKSITRMKIKTAAKKKLEEQASEHPSKLLRSVLTSEATEILQKNDLKCIKKSLYYAKRNNQGPLPKNSNEIHDTLATLNISTIQNEPFLLVNDLESNFVFVSSFDYPEMSGPPHGFQTSFANAQRNERQMRTQFVSGGGPQIPGLMANQQAAMVAQQGYGGGVVGMQPPLAQQQQQMQLQQQQLMQQQQLQQMQQQQVQQQQQQQVVGGVAQQPPPQPTQKELNTVTLCRCGQETVQDIVSRTHDVFSGLKLLQPPNGTQQGINTSNEKKAKMQEQLKFMKLLFKRLRLIYEKCNESCQLQGMEYMHIESLIPLKEEWDMKSEEKKTSELYRVACDDSKEIIEQVIQKNRQLKEVIEHLRRIIWEINTMLTMRRS